MVIVVRMGSGDRQVIRETKVQPGKTVKGEGRASQAARLLGRLARMAHQDLKAHQETEVAKERGELREHEAAQARGDLRVWQESTARQGKMPNRPNLAIARVWKPRLGSQFAVEHHR